MHLQHEFFRGPGRPLLLGDDAKTLPTDLAPGAESESIKNQDNVFATRMVSINSWPVSRICFAYIGPSADSAVRVRVFVFDKKSAAWFEVHDEARFVRSRVLSWFDCPVVIESVKAGAAPATNATIEIAFVVAPYAQNEAGDVEARKGDHRFLVGADLSASL